MATANIIIIQDGVSGEAGRSRDDLVLSSAVSLSNANNAGVTSWIWTMLDRPTGSTAELSNPHSSVATFTPDVEGTYRIELIVNQGRTGEQQIRLAAVRDVDGLRMPAAGEEDEANWDIDGEENTRGWMPDLELFLQEALTGGVTDHGALTGLADDDHTQYLLADGTRQLTGNMSVAGGVTIDGVDISGHASRHLPGGSDALSTATPVAIGTSLSEGSSSSYARSDHVHTVDISSINRIIYEVNYSTLANNTFADGTEVLDGLSYTSVNTALLGTAALVNGTGIDLRAGNSLGSGATFNATTRNAYHLYIPLSSIPGWDGRYDHLIEIYASTHVLEINGDSFFVGLWGPAGQPTNGVERVKVARISNQTGTQQLGSTNNNTSTNGTNRGTENVIGVKVSAKGEGSALFGTWSSGWPSSMQGDTNFVAETGVLSPLNHGGVRLVMGLGTSNDASATTRVLIERLRVSRA